MNINDVREGFGILPYPASLLMTMARAITVRYLAVLSKNTQEESKV